MENIFDLLNLFNIASKAIFTFKQGKKGDLKKRINALGLKAVKNNEK